MILLITYETPTPRDMSKLAETIKSAKTWWHHLDNVWLVETNEPPSAWYSKLVKHIYRNEHLFIVQVTENYYGWLPGNAWEWLGNRSF